jgi:hypothetical protein
MRCPAPNRDVTGERARLSAACSEVEAARSDESLRLYRSGVPLEEIKAHLEQPELRSPAETGGEVQTGEAETFFADPDPDPDPEAEAEAEI